MTANPRVSILMLTYNRPLHISRAISSVCSQSFKDWELLVVQDGNNAETFEIMRDWVARDSRIVHLARGVTGCIAEASNHGLRRARGEYVAILDDDDYWSDPEKLSRQVAFLDCNSEYVGCGSGYILIDGAGRTRGRFLKPETDAQIRAGALLANPIGNSTAIFRRILNGEPVMYDESMRGFADWDFWLMMGSRGKLYNFPEYLAHYALWEGGGSFTQQRVNTRAAIRIVQKHRENYRRFVPAILFAGIQHLYACLPVSIRRVSYPALSSFKKMLASKTPAGAAGALNSQADKETSSLDAAAPSRRS